MKRKNRDENLFNFLRNWFLVPNSNIKNILKTNSKISIFISKFIC